MSKQWGKAYMAGKTDAMQKAGEAIEKMQDDGVYAMALIHKLMFTHPDKELVEKTDKAILRSGMNKQYSMSMWYGSDSGMFLKEIPSMSKKQGAEILFNLARQYGWKG